MLHFRKKLSVDKLGWSLDFKNQLEVDKVDYPDSTLAATKYDERLVDCFRMIQTVRLSQAA